MPTRVQLRRGTTAQHTTFTGADGEVTVDTDKEVVVVHNGSTAGGFPLLRQDLSNLATGTITSTMIADGTIVNADINASAAIAGTKVSPNFGSQNISTTGTLAVGQASAAANTELDLNGTYAQTVVAVAALDINCSAGNYFTKTINANSTFTFSSVPASRAYSFTLELTHTSGTVTWPAAVQWPGGTAPTLTTGKTHLFMFVTDDGGTRWRASSLINYTN